MVASAIVISLLASSTVPSARYGHTTRVGGAGVRMSSVAPTRSPMSELVTLGAVTDRGQRASPAQRARADALIAELEGTPGAGAAEPEGGAPASELAGEWELVYASEAVYRASPFFAAFRKLTAGMEIVARPLGSPSNSLAEAIFRITDAVPFKDVGVARQSINATHLVSRISLSINVFDALVPRSSSVVTSSAAILGATAAPAGAQGARLARLRVERTQVLESSLGELLPFLPIGAAAFPTSAVFEQLRPGSAEVLLQTSFLSGGLRVSRYLDGPEALGEGSGGEGKGGAFVWARVASQPAISSD